MLDNLGFQHVHVTSSFAGQQGGHEFARASMQAQTSPPPMAPPVPLSWSGPERREQSLFTREQLERLGKQGGIILYFMVNLQRRVVKIHRDYRLKSNVKWRSML